MSKTITIKNKAELFFMYFILSIVLSFLLALVTTYTEIQVTDFTSWTLFVLFLTLLHIKLEVKK